MIKLKPFDVFIFGDGKPFNASEHTFRQGSFFINPVPILGALNKYTGKKLNIDFLALGKDKNACFKVPVEIKREKSTKRIITPVLKKISEAVTPIEDLKYILDYQTSEKMESFNTYLKDEEFIKYLTGEDFQITEENTITPIPEIRTGISIDHKTKTVKEGYLFTQIFYRLPEDAYFLVKTEDMENLETVSLGGEGKTAKVFKLDTNIIEKLEKAKEKIKEQVKKTKLFKIVLLTATNKVKSIEGTQIIAKNLGKPIVFSGWIKKDGKSFPTRLFKLIPEGSVIYYKLEDEAKLDEIFDKYYLKPAFFEKEYPYFDIKNPSGFGLSIIGIVKGGIK